jgi:hypothetical protein
MGRHGSDDIGGRARGGGNRRAGTRARRPRGAPDRDRLRPRRRRGERRGGGGDLCREGPPPLQPVDRPRRLARHGGGSRPLRRGFAPSGGTILAWPPDARAARRGPFFRPPPGAGRAADPRGAHAGGNRLRGGRPARAAGGRAKRQPVRQGQSDDGRARRPAARRTRRPRARRRPGGRRRRVHHRAVGRRPDRAPAAGWPAARRDRGGGGTAGRGGGRGRVDRGRCVRTTPRTARSGSGR